MYNLNLIFCNKPCVQLGFNSCLGKRVCSMGSLWSIMCLAIILTCDLSRMEACP